MHAKHTTKHIKAFVQKTELASDLYSQFLEMLHELR